MAYLHEGNKVTQANRIAVLPDNLTADDVKEYIAASRGVGVFKLTGKRPTGQPFTKTIGVNEFEQPQLAQRWRENAKNPNRGTATAEPVNPVNNYQGDPQLKDFLIQQVIGHLEDLDTKLDQVIDRLENDDEDDGAFGSLLKMAEMFKGVQQQAPQQAPQQETDFQRWQREQAKT